MAARTSTPADPLKPTGPAAVPGPPAPAASRAPGAAGATPSGAPSPDEPARMTAWVRGRVQGVGFRWFTRANALRIGGLQGFALNLGDGRVQVVAEGPRGHCDELLEWLRAGDTPGEVDGVTEIWDSPRGGYNGFAIR